MTEEHAVNDGAPPVAPNDEKEYADDWSEFEIEGKPNGPYVVINGKAGTAMQAFGRQLDPAQLASVVHYQRHAFGNDAGDMSQPQDVINLSSGQ